MAYPYNRSTHGYSGYSPAPPPCTCYYYAPPAPTYTCPYCARPAPVPAPAPAPDRRRHRNRSARANGRCQNRTANPAIVAAGFEGLAIGAVGAASIMSGGGGYLPAPPYSGYPNVPIFTGLVATEVELLAAGFFN